MGDTSCYLPHPLRPPFNTRVNDARTTLLSALCSLLTMVRMYPSSVVTWCCSMGGRPMLWTYLFGDDGGRAVTRVCKIVTLP